MGESIKGVLLAFFGILVLSPDSLLIRSITVDTWTLVFWRGVFMAAGLGICLVLIYRGGLVEAFRVMGWPGVGASLVMAVGTLIFVLAIRTTSVANTLIIVGISPLIAALLSRLWLGERVAFRTWLAIGAAMLAVYVTISENVVSGNWVGDAYAGCAAILVALHVVLARKAKEVSLVPSVAVGGFLVSLMVVWKSTPMAVNTTDMLLLALLGAVLLPAALSLLVLAPRYISAPEVSLIKLLEMILGPTWVWLVLGENPGRAAMIGGAILITTLILHTVVGRRDSDTPVAS